MKFCKNAQRLMAMLLTIVLLVTVVPMNAVTSKATTTEFAGGSGTETDPYLIETEEHLNNVRNHLDAYFKLLCDIEFDSADFSQGGNFYNNGAGFEPIGSLSSQFTGVFNGNGYSIKNLYINISSSNTVYAGLFGYSKGTVKNLGMVDCSVSAKSSSTNNVFSGYVGCIAGKNSGTIVDCYNTGAVSSEASGLSSSEYANAYSGGIAGINSGRIKDCYNAGSVLTKSSSKYNYAYAYAGGIIGDNDTGGEITKCYNVGTVSATTLSSSDYAYAGGIAGENHGTITTCYNVGTVSSGAVFAYVGGIMGINFGATTNCYNTGTVSTVRPYTYAGGIAGENCGTITNCYNTGDISAVDSNALKFAYARAGGIVGRNDTGGIIVNCYNMGIVLAKATSSKYSRDNYYAYAGGIAGENHGTITNCYNTGDISATDSAALEYCYVYAGGIGGRNSGVITNCYNIGTVLVTDSSTSPSYECYAYAGGITGDNDTGGEITNCYNVGTVSALSSSRYFYVCIGGIAGKNSATIKNSYYSDSISEGVASGTDTTTACTGAQLKQQSTFVGFDFEIVWEIDSNLEYKYPLLINKIKAVSIVSQPDNSSYIQGLNPQLTGATLKIEYDLAGIPREKLIPITLDMLDEFDNNIIGEQKVYVNYNQIVSSNQIVLNGIEKSITSIKVTKTPTKCTYVQGQTISFAGTQITAYFNNNTSAIITEDLVFEYTENIGLIPVTVSYQGFTDTFNITIGERVAKSITLIEPTDVSNFVGNEINLDGGYIKVEFESEDNYTEIMPLDMSMISGYDKNTLGYQNVTVTYAGKSKTFMVNVIAKELVSIKVEMLPNKLTYLEDDSFDETGIAVVAYYNDGTNKNVTDYTFSGYDSEPGSKTITVWYDGKTATFTVEVIAKSLTHIAVTKIPTKTTFLEAKDELTVDGGQITLYYNNGKSQTLEMLPSMITGFDNSTVGAQQLTVTYEKCSTVYSIEIIEKSLQNIVVTTRPTKIVYLEGDSFDKNGMVVTAYYNNDTSTVVTDYTINGYTSTPGNKTIIINYQEKMTSFMVEVEAKSLTSIAVTSRPNKLIYLEGETFDIDGMVVMAYYNNNTSEIVDDYTISGYDSSIGAKTVMVTYQGKTDSFLVEVARRYITGDFNNDNAVTDADALYLLYHTIYGDSYPIEQDCDYNHDGSVTDADALYLLYHTIHGDSYPLN